MADFRTSAGDNLDHIVWRYYGSTAGQVVEQVLEANPGLADFGPSLPAGIVIQLPEIKQAGQTKGVRLWD